MVDSHADPRPLPGVQGVCPQGTNEKQPASVTFAEGCVVGAAVVEALARRVTLAGEAAVRPVTTATAAGGHRVWGPERQDDQTIETQFYNHSVGGPERQDDQTIETQFYMDNGQCPMTQ